MKCFKIQALKCHRSTSVGVLQVDGNEVLDLIAEACSSKWIKWDPPIQEPPVQSTYRNHHAERWGNPGEALQLQVRFRVVPAAAWQHWMVRALQSRGGDREVGGKQNTLQAPYLPTKTCCTRWVSAGRGFNLHQL